MSSDFSQIFTLAHSSKMPKIVKKKAESDKPRFKVTRTDTFYHDELLQILQIDIEIKASFIVL